MSKVLDFDYNKYILLSQDYLFKSAINNYNSNKYDEAMSLFISAEEDGNVYALAHIGIMHLFGEGRIVDKLKAFEYFEKGYNYGCPLATAWYSRCYKYGYGVYKNGEYATKVYKENEEALKKLCIAEDTGALFFLGQDMILGIEREVNENEGFKLLEKAMFKGDVHSSTLMAECYINGWGVVENINKAVDLLMKFPNPCSPRYNFLLGKVYYYGSGVGIDYNKAFRYFEIAANSNVSKAKDYLGDCYRYGYGVEKDLCKAIRWYKDAADNSRVANSAISLAFMYKKGEGIVKDKKKAINYFMIAAEEGNVQAQRIISKEYILGEVLKKDYELARIWLEKAANTGDAKSQTTLGKFYLSNFGNNDEKKAFEMFEKAAEQGYTEAEYLLGTCYLNQNFIKKDIELALLWFDKAAKKGHIKSMYNIGLIYMGNYGMIRNPEKGIRYLIMAADENSEDACFMLTQLYMNGIEGYNEEDIYINLKEALIYAKKLVSLYDNCEYQCLLANILNKLGNIKESEEWYKKALANGSESVKLDLSRMYITEGINYSQAVSMLESFSNKENGEAQYLLAYCLENGYGCNRDKKRAKNLYDCSKINGYKESPLPNKKLFGFF